MRHKIYLRAITLLLLMAVSCGMSFAQRIGQVTNTLDNKSDSAAIAELNATRETEIFVDSSGDTLIVYKYNAVGLDEISAADIVDAENASLTSGGVYDDNIAVLKPPPLRPFSSFVGKIDITEAVSPTGARTYDIPIMTAAGCRLTPNVSLSYNSQAGNGVAGYGWNITGGSAISVVGKSIHYDGATAAADLANPATCAFSLDGVRLVENLGPLKEYQYETAQGFILVKKHMVGGNVSHFTVAYPNGNTATFGFIGNTRMLPVYPITELHDANGFTVNFYYTESDNCFYLTSIRYGGKSADSHLAEIDFTYTDRNDYTTVYVGGVAIAVSKLLTGITTSDIIGGSRTIMREYLLTHEYDEVNRLTTVACTSGSSHFQPLTFSYGNPTDNRNAALTKEHNTILSKYYSTSKGYKIDITRGKLVKGEFNDGLILLPGCFESWAEIGKYRLNILGKKYYFPAYGSTFPEDLNIMVLPSMSDYATDSIKTEKGFQTIQAVDVSGSGNDHILKLNVTGCAKNLTRFKLTEYSYDTGALAPVRSYAFSINRSQEIGGGKYSPACCSYLWGDFRGDGKSDLLIIAYDLNGNKASAHLVDLDKAQYIGEAMSLADFNASSQTLCPLDIDGDGKAELCRAKADGTMIYALAGDKFVYQRTDPTIGTDAFGERALWGDINGDGKLDYVLTPKKSYQNIVRRMMPVWSKSICPMCGQHEPTTESDAVNCSKCGGNIKQFCLDHPATLRCRVCSSVLDVGQGTSTPLCTIHGSMVECNVDLGYVDNGNTWKFCISTGKSFVERSTDLLKIYGDERIMLMDVNRDGLSDLVRLRGTNMEVYLNDRSSIQAEAVCSTEIAASAEIVPSNVCGLRSMSHFITVDDAMVYSYGFSRDFSRRHLLTLMSDSYQNRHYNNYASTFGTDRNYHADTASGVFKYPYSPLMQPVWLLQYATQTSPDGSKLFANNSYTYYNGVCHNEGLGFMGFEKTVANDNLSDRKTTEVHDPHMLGVVTMVETPEKRQKIKYSCDSFSNMKQNPKATSVEETDLLTRSSIFKTISYDAYNNPLTTVTQYGSAQRVEQAASYLNVVSPQHYLVGLPTETNTVTVRGTTFVKRDVLAYNSAYMPSSRTSYIGSGKLSETRYTYDSNGNVASEKSAPYNSTEFIGSTYTYDNNGRHRLTSTDALGHTTTYANYDMFGNPRTVTDYKGRVTSYSYDYAGRLSRMTNPDKSSMNAYTEWGGKGLYTVRQSDDSNPETIVHYDALGREIRKATLRFDDKWQIVDMEYDQRGRLLRVSLPFVGDSPTVWNTYVYDEHDRPISYTEASGRTTVWSYDGKSTTETKDGMSTTRTLDDSGQLIRVADASGTIRYTLRPDGQPQEIFAPGDAVTEFAYDSYGRRIYIDDPSLGEQTYSESYAANGTRTQTETDARGKTVTTVYDKYGRKMSVTRPEFSTTYNYDSDGNVTAESSTNGVLTTFEYDNFGNLQKKVRSIYNKSIEKSFTYVKGRLKSETITVSSGASQPKGFSIDYKYSNNHMTEAILDNQTTIWRLSDANDFGQPTEVVTGGMTRLYDYDAYGMPTRRRAGRIMDFAYRFDPLTGNLLSRTDNTRSLTETFGYDRLNRLTHVGDKAINYADNGNLLSMPGVGTLEYNHKEKPYAVTGLLRDNVQDNAMDMNIEYNSFLCPSLIECGSDKAELTYDADGCRIMMASGSYKKFYLDEYETDADGGQQILYLGGDAYTAPMAYVKQIMSASWRLVNIFRDHLGSITHIANADGGLMREYSYDAWGNMRDPRTQESYPDGCQPELYLGRGYTGHEHLANFGLINMNARLYDPETGRFLSPDPYVQMPDNTQNFNRYSYCMNNPLKYVDKDGKFFWMIPVAIGAIVGGYIGASIYSGTAAFWHWKGSAWKGALTGMVLGGTLGYYTSVAIGASGMTIGAGSEAVATKVAGTIGTVLKGGTADIASNFISTGTLENSWKAGLTGMGVGAWGITGGFGMLTGAGNNLGGLAKKLGYQMIGTCLSSMGDNWTNNKGIFSKIALGIGSVNLTLGKGQRLLQWQNNLENIAMNTFGLINTIAGGDMKFDAYNLTFVYTGGLLDKCAQPNGNNSIGFSPFFISGNSDLRTDFATYNHESHHLWHSRVIGHQYFQNYGLNGIDALLKKQSFLGDCNFYERISYGRFWW